MVFGHLVAIELKDLRTGRPAEAFDIVELGYFEGAFCLHQQEVSLDGIKGEGEAGTLMEGLTLVWIQNVLSLLVDDAVDGSKAVFQWKASNEHGKAGGIHGTCINLAGKFSLL